ncbi:MAG: ABC transporter permease [Acidimicrobiia bacterium]|nr:ABC transporter permease [Acidimicrobiia bacterium]MCY4458391.1 ABC transporter permease [Acidimicrobiaceae bacterium]
MNVVLDEAEAKKLGCIFWLAVGWLGVLVATTSFAPLLPIEDPSAIATGPARSGPSLDNWFGTDALGRDVFARTVYGARVSLVVGFVAIAFGMVVGGTLGIIAGYFKGSIDLIVNFAFFALLSFPGLVLALLITSTFDRSLRTVSLTLAVLAVAPIGRLARATTLLYGEREFVQAARVLGARHFRIITRELLPVVMIPMAALALLGMGVAIVAEGGLAFLQLSVEEISWGVIINDGRGIRDLQENPHVALMPIAAMFITILSLNFAGDRLRDYFDVRETAF